MTLATDKTDESDLDLPALDGEEEGESDVPVDALDPGIDDVGDAFDDTTGEDAVFELVVEGAEGGWLVDAENATTLDVGPFDVAIEAEGKVLGDDEADDRPGDRRHDDLMLGDESFVVDGGEEGPLADDEELREEDLPALDADEDGDVPEEALFDRAMLSVDDDLRWDDRAWERSPDALAFAADDADDSGVLAMPGDDPQSPRDSAWRKLEETGRAMAATFVSGGSVVVALATPDRARALLVRIRPDGEVRIIAEVDPTQTHGGPGTDRVAGAGGNEEDGPVCIVTFLRWDTTRGWLYVGGNFGVQAYRPTA